MKLELIKTQLTALRTFGAPQCICIAKSRLHKYVYGEIY